MTTTHFVVPSCLNPRTLPTRQPRLRNSFAWLRASLLQLLKQWLQGTLPGRRTSSIQPTSAARLFQTCSPPARFFFYNPNKKKKTSFFFIYTSLKGKPNIPIKSEASVSLLASGLPSRGQWRGEEQSTDVRIRVHNWIHRSAGTRTVGRLNVVSVNIFRERFLFVFVGLCLHSEASRWMFM